MCVQFSLVFDAMVFASIVVMLTDAVTSQTCFVPDFRGVYPSHCRACEHEAIVAGQQEGQWRVAVALSQMLSVCYLDGLLPRICICGSASYVVNDDKYQQLACVVI